MGKRLRGKAAEKLAKKTKERNSADSALSGSSWNALDSVDDDDADFKDSDEEQDYDNRPRKFQAIDSDEEVEKLPVKTLEGQMKRVIGIKEKRKPIKNPEPEAPESESELDSELEDENENEEILSDDDLTDGPQDQVSLNQKLMELKEIIAETAEKLNEEPEDHIGKLRELRELIPKSKHPKAKQLILLALVPIFKSLIPGYRIRPLSETEQKEKVTKEVKKLRNFEETLLVNYQAYIGTLQEFSKKGKGSPKGSVRYILGSSALMASCELLESVAYFNFRGDLIQIVVDKLSSKRVDDMFYRALQTIEVIFRADEEGQVSFDIVRLIAKMIKARKYQVDESVLNSLLHLRLLTELAARGDLERVQGFKDDEDNQQPKLKKKDRVHLSKKERKARKERKAINEEMMRAETAVSAEERERLQGETLKLVFILYFNILKERSNKLIGVTLEGLAKFAHLINADLFGDLLEVLRELIIERQKRLVINNDNDSSNGGGEYEFKESTTRESLLCVVTAFALLSAQYAGVGESMNLDLSFFVSHLYSSLYSLALNADIEFSHKTLRLDDPLQSASAISRMKTNNRVNISTETEMLVRSFEFVFFRQRSVGPNRVLSFAKRLATSSLHMPEKSCLASLRILDKMTKKFSVLPALFSTDDRVANGVYNMQVDDPEHSKPEAATIWETVLLEKHYSPMVAQAAKAVPNSAIRT